MITIILLYILLVMHAYMLDRLRQRITKLEETIKHQPSIKN